MVLVLTATLVVVFLRLKRRSKKGYGPLRTTIDDEDHISLDVRSSSVAYRNDRKDVNGSQHPDVCLLAERYHDEDDDESKSEDEVSQS